MGNCVKSADTTDSLSNSKSIEKKPEGETSLYKLVQNEIKPAKTTWESGVYKYICINLTSTKSTKHSYNIVRGTASCEFHAQILEKFMKEELS